MNILKLIAAKVIACQLRFREKTRHILPQIHNSNLIEANELLKHELSADPSVLYWILKGHKESKHPNVKDVIHLNREIDLPKSYRNIRRAILCALNCDG